MKSFFVFLAVSLLLASTHAFFNNASLDTRSMTLGNLNTVIMGKTPPANPFSLLRRAFFGHEKRSTPQSTCPQVWYDIATDLRRGFNGCSRYASTAIRFSFHDAGGYSSKNSPYPPANGGADGSLLLSDVEIAREDHNPMQGFREYMLSKWNDYKDQGVSAADFVQAAGNIGIRSCLGPVITTVIGREDSSEAAPEGTLPKAFGQGSDQATIVQLFADKGINARELAALMGAHTVSRSFAQQKNGVKYASPQDDTPQVWDNGYYSQTQTRNASSTAASFVSDVNLASPGTAVGESYTEFGASGASWAKAFSEAMLKLSLLGLSEDKVASLVDCTDILHWDVE